MWTEMLLLVRFKGESKFLFGLSPRVLNMKMTKRVEVKGLVLEGQEERYLYPVKV
jgi:hypothetical protein